MNYKISIIVPIYNVEKFIYRCIDSILQQTYKNIEVILVDDGSPDNCGLICDDYAAEDNRIVAIHQENKGVCAARNAALEAATGDYYGFVDPDDWAAPDMFEYLLSNALIHKSDITGCRYYRVVEGETTYSKCDGITAVYSPDEAIEMLIKDEHIIKNVFWNKLFTKRVFNGITFPVGRIYEGTAMIYKLFERANKFVLLGDPKYYYWNYDKSYVNTVSIKNQIDFVISHIDRYNDLSIKYPDLRNELFRKLVKVVKGFLYACNKKTQEELDSVREYTVYTEVFLRNHLNELKESRLLNKFEKYFLLKADLSEIRKIKQVLTASKIKNRLSALKKNLTIKARRKKKKESSLVFTQMNKYQAEKLRNLQLAETEIIDELVRLCNKHNINYYIYGGTLLGSVRHKGFIPWDDDVDIVMPRKDFEKFAEVCVPELDSKYFYQTCFCDNEFPLLIAKIRKNGTYVNEIKWDGKKNMHKGIYIDILPLDYFPKNDFLGKNILRLANLLHQTSAFKRCKSKWLLAHVLFRIIKLFPVQFSYKLRKRLLSFSNSIGSKNLYCSFGSHYLPMCRRVLKSEWFGEGIELEFEGRLYRAPSQWEQYLLHLYGEDYMSLPPEEKRVCHFDIYQTRL